MFDLKVFIIMTIKIKFAMYSVLYCVNYFLLLGMIIRYGHYYFRPGFCRNLLMVKGNVYSILIIVTWLGIIDPHYPQADASAG